MRINVRFPLAPGRRGSAGVSPAQHQRGVPVRPPRGLARRDACPTLAANNSPATGPFVLPLPLGGGEGRGEGAYREHRPFPYKRPVAAALCLLALSTLSAVAAAAESRQAPAYTPILNPEKEGAQLAARLRSAVPPEPAEFTGKLAITTRDDKLTVIPIISRMVPVESNWLVIYRSAGTSNSQAEELTITHRPDATNNYALGGGTGLPSPTVSTGQVRREELTRPFAGSDFWLCDLGLEFLHWPQQRVLRHEMRRSRSCWVLESITPTPVPGGYGRVLSWVDVEQEGILFAEAYDAAGKLKDFKLGALRKVDGSYQLESMRMRNLRTGSESELKFDLKPER